MVGKKKIIAIIPARGGSKGLPKKNIIDLGDHPLIAYSIAVAKLSKFIDRIIVTTDNKEIAQIAKKYGAEVPFLRPKKFATDNAKDIGFINHAIRWFKRNENFHPDYLVLLRPTTPLRNFRIIDNAISEIIKDKKATALRSGHFFESPAYKLFRKKRNYAEFFGKKTFKSGAEYLDFPRQKLPVTYKTNGYVDIFLPKTIKETGILHGKKIRTFITDEVADIDSLGDLDFAKQILRNKEYSSLINLLKKLKDRKIK